MKMARATTKTDLVTSANGQFEKLWKLIDSMTEEEQNAAFAFGDNFLQKQKESHWARDKNLRDVLVHLYEWHQLLLKWISANRNGEQKPFLPEPYSWKTYPAMNVELSITVIISVGYRVKSLRGVQFRRSPEVAQMFGELIRSVSSIKQIIKLKY